MYNKLPTSATATILISGITIKHLLDRERRQRMTSKMPTRLDVFDGRERPARPALSLVVNRSYSSGVAPVESGGTAGGSFKCGTGFFYIGLGARCCSFLRWWREVRHQGCWIKKIGRTELLWRHVGKHVHTESTA